MSNLIKEYIKNSAKTALKESKERFLHGQIPVHIKDSFIQPIDLDFVLKRVEHILPESLLNAVDSIYVGQFDLLNKREVNAVYYEGSIYVTNHQDDEDDLLDDIIHEIAHSVEEVRGIEIYPDGLIKQEFLGKRTRLESMLKPEGFNIPSGWFSNPEYSREFDEFLYKDVGYPLLTSLTMGLFYSPYGITSLREYFANGFEALFLHNDGHYLKKISPQLFSKLEALNE
tara:strand:- start:10 stop:693 length:684 start_codon:yes stop_codon:yes gene_type:complete